MSIYRKIYENTYGPIPKDVNGRSYEIHHIDGNSANNDIVNLKCVTIDEHYNIHLAQGDYGACLLISHRMKIDPAIKSELARQSALKQVADGKSSFKDIDKQKLRSKKGNLVRSAKHKNGDYKDLYTHMSQLMTGRYTKSKGYTNAGWMTTQRGVDMAAKNNAISSCPHCGKEGQYRAMKRWHFDNCKYVNCEST